MPPVNRIPSREHHAVQQPPAWSHPGQTFRTLEGARVDWRKPPRPPTVVPPQRELATSPMRRLFIRTRHKVRTYLDTREDRDAVFFAMGSLWTGIVLGTAWFAAHHF